MFTKATLLTSTFALLTSAMPLAPRSTGSFYMVSSHSGDANVHLRNINASGQRFFLNAPTATYCPISDCSGFSNQTAVSAGSDTSSLSMSVEVPGGQQVYIAPDGALGYTIAHSAATPEGAVTDGFQYTAGAADGQGAAGSLVHGDDAFWACPVQGQDGVYQVFVGIGEAVVTDGCTAFGVATSAEQGASAWQYS